MTQDYYIIGISGCTNSGKTTLTKKLLNRFPGSSYMCQDTYFLEPGDERLEYVEEVKHCNWEKLSALDMKKMVDDVQHWINSCKQSQTSSPVLFIEGYTIFNYKPLRELCTEKYFLTMEFKPCQERRHKRNYIPADPQGYFEKVVYPMYLINKEELVHCKDIVYFNGCDVQEQTLESILEDLQSLPELKKAQYM